MTRTMPKSRAELAASVRSKARADAIDCLRRAVSALNASLNDEPSSTRSAALSYARGRVLALIAEIKLL